MLQLLCSRRDERDMKQENRLLLRSISTAHLDPRLVALEKSIKGSPLNGFLKWIMQLP